MARKMLKNGLLDCKFYYTKKYHTFYCMTIFYFLRVYFLLVGWLKTKPRLSSEDGMDFHEIDSRLPTQAEAENITNYQGVT
jgi:hypothetical protein